MSNPKFTCMGCRLKFENSSLQREHFKTEWHLYNIKRRVCNLDPIDLNSFDELKELQRNNPKQETPKEKRANSKKLNPEDSSNLYSKQERLDELENTNIHEDVDVDEEIDSEEWETDEEDFDELDDEEDPEETKRMMKNVIRPDTCLFCAKQSPTVMENVNHMYVHGFFIPEERFLDDIDGLIEYLGFKVGAGTTCLWCNKQFRSIHGVRLHMLYKDHCKIRYDQEQAVAEYSDFYDYSENYPDKEIKSKNGSSSDEDDIDSKELWIDDNWQMHIPKAGKSIGHRSLFKYYKQRLAPTQVSGPYDLNKAIEFTNNRGTVRRSIKFRPGALLHQNKDGSITNVKNNLKWTGLTGRAAVTFANDLKRFNKFKNKIVLRTGMQNNMTMRGRIRQQCPI